MHQAFHIPSISLGSSKPILAKRKYKLAGGPSTALKTKKTDSEDSENSASTGKMTNFQILLIFYRLELYFGTLSGLYGSKGVFFTSILLAYFYCY